MKKIKRNRSTHESTAGGFSAAVERYAQKRIKRLEEHLASSRTYFAVDGIHDLRVEIKRIRALLELMKAVMPSIKIAKEMKAIRPLFKKAGQLRDIDIQQVLVLQAMKSHELSEYFNTLKKQELVLRPDFVKECRAFNGKALRSTFQTLNQAMKKQPEERVQAKLSAYAQKNLQRLLVLAKRKKQTDECKHEIRKLVKVLRYTFAVWKPLSMPSAKCKRVVAHLKVVAEQLGRWHDAITLSQSLTSYLEHDAPDSLFDRSAYNGFLTQLAGQGKRSLTKYEQTRKALLVDISKLKLV